MSNHRSSAATAPSSSAAKPKPKKITGGNLAGALLRNVINPAQLFTAARLQVNRKKHRHSHDDAQLALYSRIFPTDFLHFGYFDDVTRQPEDMSLSDITRAQSRYADVLLELVTDRSRPVLDVGCGMGGLSRLLKGRGFDPVALTPDRLQAAHMRNTQPDVPVLHCKLERLTAADHAQRFGTIITAESLQYLKLDASLPILKTLLAPGGRWVACDFFHKQPSEDRSCHNWDAFGEKLRENGWRISHERNVTAHVLPTLKYANMWATQFGIPLMHFAFLRLRRKAPGVHHLAANTLTLLEKMATQNIKVIDPEVFAAEKRYMLLVMERVTA